ncbi:MAG: TIGR00730 family Rossman fold protein [Gammaproteobacteria bacterium]|nr:TIGR00730 family Rossman fold protein [Gammaproteobacteria bacterium]
MPERQLRSICVFCGSQPGRRPVYTAAARELGVALASRGIRVIYGGGRVGLMGTLADSAMAAGGEVVGVIPRDLLDREVGHEGLTLLEVVDSMHQRKARMAELADAFIALPGGYGTFEELFEALTWCQLGIHAKPCGLLDIDGYFAGLRQQLERSVDDGLLRPQHAGLLAVAQDVPALLLALERLELPPLRRWLSAAQT